MESEGEATPSDTTGTVTPQPGDPSPQTAHRTPPKNGIPPKRPPTTAKRTVASTPNAAYKETASSTSRATAGNSLSKPPTRPPASSAVRRPIPNTPSRPTSSLGHKARASLSSVDSLKTSTRDLQKETGPTGIRRETSDVKRGSIAAKSATRTPGTSSNRRSMVAPLSTVDRKTTNTRAATESPTKPATKAPANTSRPSTLSSNSKSSRPLKSAMKESDTRTDSTKKRLSTIPASPATGQQPDSSTPKSLPSASKPLRPALVQRKSTMSITIEQRLREMELVSQMLRIAMSNDTEADDETKEQFGQQADEELAALKAKLEEARQREGREPLEADQETFSNSAENPTIGKTPEINENESVRLEKTRQREGREPLETDQEASLTPAESLTTGKTPEINENEELSSQLSDSQAQVWQLVASHGREKDESTARLAEAEARYETLLEKSQKDLSDAKKIFTEQGSRTARAELERDKDEAINDLQSTIAKLRQALRTEHQKKAEGETARADQLEAVAEKDRALEKKDEHIILLRGQLENQQNTHQRLLQEAESARGDLIESAKEAQEKSHSEIAEIQDELNAKAQAIYGLNDAITSLQDKVQSTYEDGERAREALRLEVVQESREAVERLRQEYEDARDREIVSREGELQALSHEYEETMRDLSLSHEHAMNQMRKEHSRSSAQLQDALDDSVATTAALQKRVKDLEIKCEDEEAKSTLQLADLSRLRKTSENASAEAEKALFDARDEVKRLEALQFEHTEELAAVKMALSGDVSNTETTKASLETALRGSLEEIVGLKSRLEALARHNEGKDEEIAGLKSRLEALAKQNEGKDEDHATALKQARDDLEATKRSLEEKGKESSSHAASHQVELKELQDTHDKMLAEVLKDVRTDYDAAVAKLQEDIERESEKREKERRQGADVHDRLAHELDHMRLELVSCKEKMEASRKDAEIANAREQETQHAVAKAHRLAELARADTEKKQSDGLRTHLRDTLNQIEAQTTKIRELEAALKVTNAEIVELKTERHHQANRGFVNSPPPMNGLRSSRWEANNTPTRGGLRTDQVQGQLAAIKEQVRHLDSINDEMEVDAQRMVTRMSRMIGGVENMPPNPSSASPRKKGDPDGDVDMEL